MADIKEAAAIEVAAQRIAAEMAGVEIDCRDLAIEAAETIRRCDALAEAADAVAKQAASERRKIVDDIEARCKAAKRELAATGKAMRQMLMQYLQAQKQVAAGVATGSDIESQRQTLIAAGMDIEAEMLTEPAPGDTDIDNVSIGRRRTIAIDNAETLCAAILAGELPHDLLALNESVARNLINTGHTTPGLSITETEYLIIRSET